MTEENKVVENVEEKKEMSTEEKKAYARLQYQFLKDQGIKDRLRLSRIFKAAGPGQIQEAWKLADCTDWEKDPVGKDVLECILEGACSLRMPIDRIQQVLENLEFYVPQSYSAGTFFRILEGAHEIIVPGSYHFTKKEMQEIEDGLKPYNKDNVD